MHALLVSFLLPPSSIPLHFYPLSTKGINPKMNIFFFSIIAQYEICRALQATPFKFIVQHFTLCFI